MPNSQILWVRVDLTSGERKFVTLPLRDFYEYIDLPVSSIGGWTEGELGTDEAGMRAHLDKYKHGGDGSDISRPDAGDEDNDLRGDDPLPNDLLDGSESPERAVETELPEP